MLPQIFPEHLPGNRDGYGAFGVFWDAGRAGPGRASRSRRSASIPRVAPNCALLPSGQLPAARRRPGPARQRRRPARASIRRPIIRFLDPRRPRPALHRRSDHGARSRRSTTCRLGARDLSLPADPGDAQGAAGAGPALRLDGQPAGLGTRTDRSVQSRQVSESRPAGRRHDRQLRHDAALGCCGELAATNTRQFSLHWDGLQTDLHETVVSGAIGDGMTYKSFPRTQGDARRA